MRFSPVAGIQWVETWQSIASRSTLDRSSFSPVAGIQWVETVELNFPHSSTKGVSVPLPGFSGLRPFNSAASASNLAKFQSRCRDSVG